MKTDTEAFYIQHSFTPSYACVFLCDVVICLSSEVALVVMVPRMVAEDVGTIMACARISSLIPGGAVVTISTSDGTATSE